MKKRLIENIKPPIVRKYGYACRIQEVGDYLIINGYWNRGLKFRHVLNTETHEYGTLRGKNWTKEQLSGALNLNYYKNQYYCTETFRKEGKERLPVSKADKETLERRLGECFTKKINCKYGANGLVLIALDEIEQDYERQKRRNAEDRRIERIGKEMEKVPVPPVSEIKAWIDQEITGGKHYLLRHPEKKVKPYDWTCSACGHTVSEKTILFYRDGKQFKDGEKVICPSCGAALTAQKKRKTIDVTQPFVILQNLDDITSVVRHFRARLICNGQEAKEIALAEDIRIMMYRQPYGRRGIRWDIYYEQSYNGSGAWYGSEEWQPGYFDNKSNPFQKRERTGLLYPKGIEDALKGTIYEEWTRTFTAAAAKGVHADWNRLMCTSMNDGNILPGIEEMMIKGRFYRLFTEISEDISLWNQRYVFDEYADPQGDGGVYIAGESLEEVFRIDDRQLINRIRDRDGGGYMLEWMRWSERHVQKVSDKFLTWALENKLNPTEKRMNWILCRFSPEQAMNFLERQRKESYKGKAVSVVIEEYADYMDMCQKLKKDTSDEMVYRPRELKRRHDEAVAEMEAREASIQAAEYAKKYPEAEKVLKQIKKKLEYKGTEYMIIVPRHIADIVADGRFLHHCAGATDRYFDRIKSHETYICFLREAKSPTVPFYTIEVEPGGTIRQHRGMYDEEPDIEKVKPFLREWQKEIKARMDKEDKKKAKVSKKKREENIRELKEKNNTRVLQGLMEDFMDAAAV